ncbi:MAG TPA: SPOR domain-containing protein [Sphingomicrobium sp.]
MTCKPVSRTRVAALILSFVGLIAGAPSARAQLSYQPLAPAPVQAESATDRLSRYLRQLAATPRDFQALIGAGRASLDLGDPQSAVGFFGRADEVYPSSPLPQIGMGAATVLEGDGDGALVYFARAQRIGATVASMGADRGLAFDLLGRHPEAQSDYRAALSGPQGDEARRRLAISLAVSGDRDGALTMLTPLLARRDAGAVRTRALVLALTGDSNGARVVIEAAMPGSWPQMSPFIARFGTLNSAQKIAAANLGIFPGSGQPALPAGPLATAPSAVAMPGSNLRPDAGRDRLADIDALLRAPAAVPQVQSPPQQATTVPVPAGSLPAVSTASTASTPAVTTPQRKRFWVQLASGPNAAALPEQLRRIRGRSEDLLNGISGYVAEEPNRARLLVGPFRSSSDAETFAQELESLHLDAFRWISADGQVVRKLANE